MPDWFISLSVIVMGGLTVSAVGGNILMFRQVGRLEQALEGLTKALDRMIDSADKAEERDRVEKVAIHQRIDRLKRREC